MPSSYNLVDTQNGYRSFSNKKNKDKEFKMYFSGRKYENMVNYDNNIRNRKKNKAYKNSLIKNKNANINTNINKKIINNFDKNILYKTNSIDDKYPLSQKNSIYYIKKVKQSNKVNKIFSIVIKDISTKDNLIQINIKYYFTKRAKPLKPRYNSLQQEKILSLTFYGDDKKQKKKKFKDKLTSIQEEDISIQNSKIYDEVEIAKKILEFIEIINDSIIKKYKKNFLYRIKTIELVYKMNNIFNLKENNKEEKENKGGKEIKDNKDNKEEIIKRIIYNKKRGYKINKKSSLENKNKVYKEQINKFRLELIKFSINSIRKK
jgi:hypothetical protein